MKRFLFLFIGSLLVLTACSAPPALAFFATATPSPSVTPLPPTTTPTPLPSPTATETASPTLTPTATITPTATPVLVMQGPGKVVCPILLYHRIDTPEIYNEYFVTEDEFRQQMQALKDWGYTTITVGQLVDAINFGAPLPERPVIISFDDGDITVYTRAFPIMQEFGFTGINYLVYNYISAEGYMTPDQILTLSAAGWEIGSHSMSHKDLTQSTDPDWQIGQSQASLEELFGLPVESFAYPFGQKTDGIMDKVSQRYRAGMGLGSFLEQGPYNLYYLWRRPVKLGWDVQTFGSFLPWNTPVVSQ